MQVSVIATGVLALTGLLALWTTGSADAQCGSQASSCKNCHEVQGQDPVNTDGNGWHTGHAFGDFCYICHGGNNQAADKDAAHAGMAPPLSDVQAACQQCHSDDLMARAQVYAAALGVEVGTGGGAAPAAAAPAQPTPASPAATESPAPAPGGALVVEQPTIDYVQQYNESVLGEKPVNWGNLILGLLIALIVVVGGGFVIHKEGLVSITFGETKKPKGEYPIDVVAMLPEIASLKPQARKSLKHILGSPKKAERILSLIAAVVDEKTKEEAK